MAAAREVNLPAQMPREQLRGVFFFGKIFYWLRCDSHYEANNELTADQRVKP